jgi:hypothetical protein
MLHCGLRAKEVLTVSHTRIRNLSESGYMIRVLSGTKTGFRVVTCSDELKKEIVMIANAFGLKKGHPVIQALKRTVQRWVAEATERLQKQHGNEDCGQILSRPASDIGH